MKKNIYLLGILTFILLFLPINVQAANTVNVKQISDSSNSITLECEVYSTTYSYCTINVYADVNRTMLLNTVSFQVPNAKVKKEIVDLPSASTVYCLIGLCKSHEDTDPVWVQQVKAVTTIGDFEGTYRQTKAGDNSATVEVTPIYGATEYIYSLYSSDGKLVGNVKSSKTECEFTGLNNKESYYTTVQPVISTNDYESVSDYYLRIELACKPDKPKKIVCNSIDTSTAAASFTITGGKADFYEVEIYDKKGNLILKDTTTQKSFSITNSKLLKPKFFKVRVRAGVELDSGKTYSAKSPFTYFTSLPSAKAKRISAKKVKLSWSKNSDASYYDVYFYTTGSSPVKVAKKIKKNKVTLKLNTVKGKSYTVKIVPVIKVKKTVYKSVRDTNDNYSLQVMF